MVFSLMLGIFCGMISFLLLVDKTNDFSDWFAVYLREDREILETHPPILRRSNKLRYHRFIGWHFADSFPEPSVIPRSLTREKNLKKEFARHHGEAQAHHRRQRTQAFAEACPRRRTLEIATSHPDRFLSHAQLSPCRQILGAVILRRARPVLVCSTLPRA